MRALLCSASVIYAFSVIPAQAGIQFQISRFASTSSWFPACAGMTTKCLIEVDQLWVNLRASTQFAAQKRGRRGEPAAL
jgi:hypothetical protein